MSLGRIGALEGLRGAAAAIVVVRHTTNAIAMPEAVRRMLLEMKVQVGLGELLEQFEGEGAHVRTVPQRQTKSRGRGRTPPRPVRRDRRRPGGIARALRGRERGAQAS